MMKQEWGWIEEDEGEVIEEMEYFLQGDEYDER